MRPGFFSIFDEKRQFNHHDLAWVEWITHAITITTIWRIQ